MPISTEGRHAGEFLLSESNGHISRDNIVVASGAGKLAAGTVIAKVTASGKYVAAVATASDGSQTAVGVLWDAVDATSADAVGVAISRNAEVNGKTLSYDASVNDNTKITAKNTQLATVGILVR